MPDRSTYTYLIDGEDRIEAVSPGWADFARNNGALELGTEDVIGHTVWDYIAGAEARALYRMLFDRVRKNGRPRTVPFRCDGPDRRRFMELRVSQLDSAVLAVRSTLLREEQREPMPFLTAGVPRTDEFLSACAWCMKLDVEGVWLEVEDAVERLDLFGQAALPQLSHGICSACAAAFADATELL